MAENTDATSQPKNTFKQKFLSVLSRIDPRAGWIGILVWLGWVLIQTGMGGLTYIGLVVGVTAFLTLCCTATRTITIRTMAIMFVGGAICMILSLFIIRYLCVDHSHPMRAFFVPLIEETCMLLPVIGILWWMKKATVFLTVTDFFLLALAAGAGYESAELACIQAKADLAQLAWMPLVLYGGDRIFGQSLASGQTVWLSLAGLGFGFASILRRNKPLAYVIAGAGIAFGLFDHMLVNFRVQLPGNPLLKGLTLLTMNGLATPLLFYAALIAAIVVDLWIFKGYTPEKIKSVVATLSGKASHRWNAMLAARCLAMGGYHYSKATTEQKEDIGRMSLPILGIIVEESRRTTPTPPLTPAG